VNVSLSKAEVHWRDFFKSLIERGLFGIKLMTSDVHAGLTEARKACFPGVPWQRCRFHLMKNALAYVPREERISRELKRRTRVATLFPNDVSLLRLVTAF
jgi:transposase-like protein